MASVCYCSLCNLVLKLLIKQNEAFKLTGKKLAKCKVAAQQKGVSLVPLPLNPDQLSQSVTLSHTGASKEPRPRYAVITVLPQNGLLD